MQCPIDGTELLITHRDGIEIDYCPQCRGVWLDRGELDKLVEKAQLAAMTMRAYQDDDDDGDDDKRKRRENRDFMKNDFKRKRGITPTNKRSTGEMAKAFLNDLFDF